MTTIEVVTADITTLPVDAIVNAANEHLQAGGGVCGAIFAAAGVDELQRACDAIGGCAVGHAVATPSFALAERGISTVIHAVGPRWNGNESECDALLASAYRESVSVADELAVRTLAFPAISTGIFGFPADRAAAIATRTLHGLDTSLDRIVLVAFDAASAQVLSSALDDVA